MYLRHPDQTGVGHGHRQCPVPPHQVFDCLRLRFECESFRDLRPFQTNWRPGERSRRATVFVMFALRGGRE